MKRLVAALLLVATNAYADTATATAAFEQAEALVKQGKLAEACPLYEASFHADPGLGALVHAADCHEKVGQVATAWSEWTDAIDLATKNGDQKRLDIAKRRAAALEPKLAKLHLAPPKQLIPGLIVKRDGADITVLVGTDIPLDPGDHAIEASAAGYQTWTKTVSITTPGKVDIEIPVLDKQVVEAPKPVVHEGTLKITTLATAEILLDQQRVGTGSYEAKVKSGGHTLRVVAGGMRPYQSEIVVGDDEIRSIDVPLEKEPEAVVIKQVVAAPVDESPSYEVGVSLGGGVKLRNEKPLVTVIRGEIAFRFGKRTNFGFFVEEGEIDKSNACGYDMPGAVPATPFDIGPRNQFTECRYLMPGLQLMVHVLPDSSIDPYLGLAPGFRFGFTQYTPYIGGVAQMPISEMFPGIVANIHAGVDYRPRGAKDNWQVGGYVDGSLTAFGDEAAHDQGYSKSGQTYLTLLMGLRTSLTW